MNNPRAVGAHIADRPLTTSGVSGTFGVACGRALRPCDRLIMMPVSQGLLSASGADESPNATNIEVVG